MFKIIIFVFSVALFGFGCGSGTTGTEAGSPLEIKPPVVDNQITEGRTVNEIDLWANPDINPRLEKLLGRSYANMRTAWQTDVPVRSDSGVFMITGCERDSCRNNRYVIFVDTNSNNINVVHMRNGGSNTYKEKGEIVLPKVFADELAAMKSS
jgi:hypothetical protein